MTEAKINRKYDDDFGKAKTKKRKKKIVEIKNGFIRMKW